jgi:hypothetical protein
VRLDRTVGPSRVAVCFANRGRHRVALYGNAPAAARSSVSILDGRRQPGDVELEFGRPSRSYAAVVPDMLRRAALFGFTWEGAWTYVVLALLLLIAGPVLIARAVNAAERDGAPQRDPSRAP